MMAQQKITKNMGILDVVTVFPDAATVFQDFGMHCLGCMAAHFENIEQGCIAHGIDADRMVDAINARMEGTTPKDV